MTARLAILFLCGCGAAAHVQLPVGNPKTPHADYLATDDGPHPSSAPDYFEWWYYDVTFEDNSTASIVLYGAAMVDKSHAPGVMLNLSTANGAVYNSFTSMRRDELHTSAVGDIAVANSSAMHEGSLLHVQAEGVAEDATPLAVDLHFVPQMAGLKLGDGALKANGKTILGWVIPMPRAEVTGTVTIGGKTRTVHGIGYHDHNWGEVDLQESMAYWYWGRVTTANLSVIYAELHLQPQFGSEPIGFVLVGDATHMVGGFAEAQFSPHPAQFVDAANRPVPQGLDIKGAKFSLELDQNRVLQAVDFADRVSPWQRPLLHLVSRPAYLRTLCDYRFSSELDSVPATSVGHALVEYMYVRSL